MNILRTPITATLVDDRSRYLNHPLIHALHIVSTVRMVRTGGNFTRAKKLIDSATKLLAKLKAFPESMLHRPPERRIPRF